MEKGRMVLGMPWLEVLSALRGMGWDDVEEQDVASEKGWSRVVDMIGGDKWVGLEVVSDVFTVTGPTELCGMLITDPLGSYASVELDLSVMRELPDAEDAMAMLLSLVDNPDAWGVRGFRIRPPDAPPLAPAASASPSTLPRRFPRQREP